MGIVRREAMAENTRAQEFAACRSRGIAMFLQPIGEDEARRIVVGMLLDVPKEDPHLRPDEGRIG
jgi:hypothetical protein